MRKAVVLATVVMALLFASVALADESSLLSGYGGQAALGSRMPGAAKPPTGSTLPFTGLELLPIAAGGVALVLAGAALRRGARRKSERANEQ